MATTGAQLDRLVGDSHHLEDAAERIQGKREIIADREAIRTLASTYHSWYARALAVISDDELVKRFRSAYEGGAISPRIKSFLSAPEEPNMIWSEEGDGFVSYWLHPFGATFRKPLLEQRGILEEQKAALAHAGASAHLDLLEQLCLGFGDFARTLADRSRQRPPLVMEDEYDVQYALHALLCLFFGDVRPEDTGPQHAGARSRVDFRLTAERTFVEAKMTRASMSERTLGDELLLDIARYKTHSDCDALVALVYDPTRRIKNPRAIENDLTRNHDGLLTRVYIAQ